MFKSYASDLNKERLSAFVAYLNDFLAGLVEISLILKNMLRLKVERSKKSKRDNVTYHILNMH